LDTQPSHRVESKRKRSDGRGAFNLPLGRV
jgi:hypothetical protein